MPLRNSLRLICLLALSATLPAAGWAALTWDTRKVELITKPGDKEAVAVFRFTNAGNSAVTITSVVPTCGCTTTELAKRTYAPGESGEIRAVLALGDRSGVQEKLIQVITDDAPTAPTALVLHATIPEQFTTSARMLLWRTAEVLTEKAVIITNSSPQKMVSIEALPAAPGTASTRIEELAPGTKFRITILPASISQPATHALPFLARFADQTTQQLTVHVVIK